MRSPAPSRRAMGRSGGPGTALVVRPTHRPVGASAPIRRASRPLPGRRSVRIGDRRYDRDQAVAVAVFGLVFIFLAQQGAGAVVETIAPDTVTAADAQGVLDVALSQVGTVEGRGGGTPFHDQYGIADREPWCAVWVWTVFQDAGMGELVPKTAWTPAMAQHYRDRDRFDHAPQVGDLVFYDWPGDGKDRISHVGIVSAVGPDSITTIEGNTSAGAGGSQDNGDGVYQRVRPLNSSIVGFGHPTYT